MKDQAKIALVVGGNGFLGSHLVPMLLAGGFQVRVYGRAVRKYPGEVAYFRGDIQERELLREAMRDVQYVFHFAWTTVPQTSNDEPQWDVQSNVATGIGLLEACCDAGVKTLVFPSTGGAVYGTTASDLIDESTPTDPICSYGITKLMMEKYLSLYRHLRKLDYRILRITNAYGEGQPADRPQGLIGVSLKKVALNEPIVIWGDGSAVRDYVYAGDIADCCIKAAVKPLSSDSSRLFNVSSGQGYSVRDVIQTIGEVTGHTPAVTYASARSCDVDRVVLSNRKAKDILEWTPRTSLHEGIGRAWNWVRNQYSGGAA